MRSRLKISLIDGYGAEFLGDCFEIENEILLDGCERNVYDYVYLYKEDLEKMLQIIEVMPYY